MPQGAENPQAAALAGRILLFVGPLLVGAGYAVAAATSYNEFTGLFWRGGGFRGSLEGYAAAYATIGTGFVIATVGWVLYSAAAGRPPGQPVPLRRRPRRIAGIILGFIAGSWFAVGAYATTVSELNFYQGPLYSLTLPDWFQVLPALGFALGFLLAAVAWALWEPTGRGSAA